MSSDVRDALENALQKRDAEASWQALTALSIDEQRRVVAMLDPDDREALVKLLPSAEAAELIEHLTETQAVDLLEEVPPETAANIVHELPEEVSGDLLREMHAEESQAILEQIEDDEESAQLRRRVAYEADTAGGLMTADVIAFPLCTTIETVRTQLSEQAAEYSDETVQYVYVTDDATSAFATAGASHPPRLLLLPPLLPLSPLLRQSFLSFAPELIEVAFPLLLEPSELLLLAALHFFVDRAVLSPNAVLLPPHLGLPDFEDALVDGCGFG